MAHIRYDQLAVIIFIIFYVKSYYQRLSLKPFLFPILAFGAEKPFHLPAISHLPIVCTLKLKTCLGSLSIINKSNPKKKRKMH